jgi:hypothetical protein
VKRRKPKRETTMKNDKKLSIWGILSIALDIVCMLIITDYVSKK